ncbi:MAG TPA: hypothetical protein VGQ76_16000 [Thermoanaerobaculia bacterium]|nr:hypothetical protein [Thermoanaerobaculia bacterium]
MYLELFHGRRSADEELDDWGFEGPVLGPFRYVHVTYASIVHVQMNDTKNMIDCDFDLEFDDDCLAYDGKFYGDYSVIGADLASCRELLLRHERPSDTLRKLRLADTRNRGAESTRKD